MRLINGLLCRFFVELVLFLFFLVVILIFFDDLISLLWSWVRCVMVVVKLCGLNIVCVGFSLSLLLFWYFKSEMVKRISNVVKLFVGSIFVFGVIVLVEGFVVVKILCFMGVVFCLCESLLKRVIFFCCLIVW